MIIMGIFSLFTSCKEPPHQDVTVDISGFRIGATALGQPPSPNDPFSAALKKRDVYKPKGKGMEIGTKDGVLDYIFLTIDEFKGTFTSNGIPIELGDTEGAIQERFGEAYWVDRSDGELILFYEYQGGDIELQFEFPDTRKLGYITIARNGVLSEAEQRNAYGVDKPWPPTEGE